MFTPQATPTRLFLHYLDVHYLKLKSIRNEERIFDEARLATRLALLAASDGIFIPASSYFESRICSRIIGELSGLYDTGLLTIVGGGFSLDEFVDEKLLQYKTQSDQYRAYSGHNSTSEPPPFHTRRCSATADIRADWLATLRAGQVASSIVSGIPMWRPPIDIERKWESTIEELGDLAFTVDHAYGLLFPSGAPPQVRNRVHAVIDRAYFKSYLTEFRCGIVRDLVYLDAPYTIESWGCDLSYRRMREHLRRFGLLSRVGSADTLSLLQLRDDQLVLSARSACMMPAIHKGGTGMLMENDVVSALARQFDSREGAQRIWRSAGGVASDVPQLADVETMWSILWERADLGAAVTKEALVAEALRKFPRSAPLGRWCQDHANPDVRRAVSAFLDQIEASEKDDIGRLLTRVLEPIPDLTAHAVEVGSIAALADVSPEKRQGTIKWLTEAAKAGSLGALKATVETAVKVLVNYALASPTG